MFNKFELIGILGSIGLMAVALFLLRVESTVDTTPVDSQSASVVQVVDEQSGGLEAALQQAYSEDETLSQLVIDDVVIGTGQAVEAGDEVSVQYVGRLENGQEFDSSYNRAEPFTFTVGEGRVIQGWEEGILGMQVGGQRVLVIPPALAYGTRGMGPIPPNATLLFLIELVAIN